MSAPAPGPRGAAKKELSDAVTWALLAAAFAVGMVMYAVRIAPEKRNFYLVAGGIGAIIAAVNGYGAWTLYNKSKPK